MKLLLDQNLSHKLCHLLGDLYPESTQVRLIGLDHATDLEIWKYAKENGFAILTQDSDMWDMSCLNGHPPKVIWLRCGNRPTLWVHNLLRSNKSRIAVFENDSSVGCLEIY